MKPLYIMLRTAGCSGCKAMLCVLAIALLHGCASKMNNLQTPAITKTPENEAAARAALAAPIHNSALLFDGGTGIYHSFRIPSIIKTNNGTLIAFAEGRRWSPADFGDINVVFKRSLDNGNTWSDLGEVAASGAGTWGNPTAVYDWQAGPNGRVWLFMSWNDENKTSFSSIKAWGDRRVFSSYSDDHGEHWSVPQDMTSALLPPGYTWDAMGPGIGIQTVASHAGRLIIPAFGRNIYSDDHGASWHYQLLPGGTDESTIVELLDGSLLRNDRPGTTEWNTAKRRRKSVGSIENGFAAWAVDNALIDPKCEASVIRYNTDAPARLIFLNPNNESKRCNMTVRISYDEGNTWARSRSIYDWNTCDYTPITIAKGGYSSMIKTADYAVAALIEINEDVHNSSTSNKSVEFHKFNLAWILNGAGEP
ncbi:sialidase family protein [Deminuibacter soli]|nr:sialidase family protein [Deminuibacter soli]